MKHDEDELARLLRDAGPPPGPDAATLARLRAHAQAEWAATVTRARRARMRTWALAASVLLALAVLLPLGLNSSRAVPVAHIASAATAVGDSRIERGTRRSRSLPADALATGDVLTAGRTPLALRADGSALAALRIDAGTRILWRGPRELELLSGRVYVDSGVAGANDATASALEISVGDARVRHVGTQYVVARDGATARVVVREGRVHIDLAEGAAEITRGEAATFTTAGGGLRSLAASLTGADWAWAEAAAPRVPLEGRDLYGVLAQLARETGRELRFENPEAERQARETILHGPALDLPPSETLRMLLSTSGFESAGADAELVISTR